MRILTLLGSARKKGNTTKVLGWMEEELRNLGHQVEQIRLSSKDVRGCLACSKCRRHFDKPGCVQPDDVPAIHESMIKAQAVVYASPLYFWGFSGQMKNFIDRGYCLTHDYDNPAHASLIEGQRTALLVTAGGAFEDNGELIVDTYERVVDYTKSVSAGHLFVADCTTPEEIPDEIRIRAVELARRLAG